MGWDVREPTPASTSNPFPAASHITQRRKDAQPVCHPQARANCCINATTSDQPRNSPTCRTIVTRFKTKHKAPKWCGRGGKGQSGTIFSQSLVLLSDHPTDTFSYEAVALGDLPVEQSCLTTKNCLQERQTEGRKLRAMPARRFQRQSPLTPLCEGGSSEHHRGRSSLDLALSGRRRLSPDAGRGAPFVSVVARAS